MFNILRKYKSNYGTIVFLIVILLIAIFSHTIFITNFIENEQYMVGPADHLRQMIIFKDYLYEQFTNGDFFYSFSYSGGGNFFTALSYYYTTNIFFYLTVLITYILESLSLITSPDLTFWANTVMYVSIFRTFLILLVTTKFIETFNVRKGVALVASTFYGISIIYFRHVVLWEMFADAMLWLPIILLGVEHILHEGKINWFVFGIFLTLFNNGYFAFINILFTCFYILLRIPFLLRSEWKLYWKIIKKFFIATFFGFFMSLPGFFPFVLGYFNSSRLNAEFEAEFFLFDIQGSNIFFTDPILLLPTLFILLFFTLSLYKSKEYIFFSMLSLMLICLRYSPKIASIFNGFSYPQDRWNYITYLIIAVAIGIGLERLLVKGFLKVNLISILLSSFITFFVYRWISLNFPPDISRFLSKYWLVTLILYTIVLVLMLVNKFIIRLLVLGCIIFLSFLIVLDASESMIISSGSDKVDKTYVKDYENLEVKSELDEIMGKNKFYRTDHTFVTNKTLLEPFQSIIIYNSFLNRNIREFNEYHGVSPDKDNNNVVSGFAGRAVINRLLNIDYIFSEENNYRIPFGYEVSERNIGQTGKHNLYVNKLPFSFIHPVKELYSYDQFTKDSYKDYAITKGAIVPNELSNTKFTDNKSVELDYDLAFIDAEYKDNKLSLNDSGRVEINISNINEDFDEVIFDYTLVPLAKGGTFNYDFLSYRMQLSSPNNPYSSQIYRRQVHINPTNQISLNLNRNTEYIFYIHSIKGIDLGYIEDKSTQDQTLNYELSIGEDEIDIYYENRDNHTFMVLPIFMEPGWNVEVNGKEVDIINTNNGMIGFEIPRSNDISIRANFKQPYFKITVFISLITFVCVIIFVKKKI